MGVRECFRDGCSNIMCDRYSSRFGYICGECFNELVTYLKNHHTRDWYDVIGEFMASEKHEDKDSMDHVIEEWLDGMFTLQGGLR